MRRLATAAVAALIAAPVLAAEPDSCATVRFSDVGWSDITSTTAVTTTILQALMLMNGQFITDVTSLEKGEVLGAIGDVPGWDTRERVTALFLTSFARAPLPDELERFASYVDRGGPHGDKNKALADVFWVLLNSPEFLFNH